MTEKIAENDKKLVENGRVFFLNKRQISKKMACKILKILKKIATKKLRKKLRKKNYQHDKNR